MSSVNELFLIAKDFRIWAKHAIDLGCSVINTDKFQNPAHGLLTSDGIVALDRLRASRGKCVQRVDARDQADMVEEITE
jgi:hypothetical protein